MAQENNVVQPAPGGESPDDSGAPEQVRPLVTRRDFLIGSGAGAVAVGVVAGAGYAVSQGNRPATAPLPAVPVQPGAPGAPAVAVPPVPGGGPAAGQQPAQPAAPQPAQPAAAPAPGALPLSQRRVGLNVDGVNHDVVVDVRESLWETLTNRLGQASSNVGCDRAQCGACTVVVDGRAVNSCSVLSARLGRGQKITTVNSLTKGPGPDGLHPIQKAFWWEGGYQCGICTRGFIMSTYALLQANKSPSDDQIADALGGNICRCGEYAKIFGSVKAAAATMRGEQVKWTTELKIVAPPKPTGAPSGAAATGQSKEFEFVTPLPTIEFFDPLAEKLKERKGVLEVSGSERTISLTWDTTLSETEVRRILAEIGNPVK